LPAILIGAAVLLAGCESTQSRSAELESEAVDVANQEGLEVRKSNPDVKVLGTELLQDEVGAALAVEVRNESKQGMRNVRISLDILDGEGRKVFQNNLPGLEPALVSVPVIGAGQSVQWVHDQVLVSGKVKSARVKVGAGEPLEGEPPRLEVSKPKLEEDPVSGVEATGTVTNRSSIEQRKLVLYAVARRGGEVVAAGRGAIDRLKAKGKSLAYHIFFIGDPKGAEVTVTAPPTTFEAGGTP